MNRIEIDVDKMIKEIDIDGLVKNRVMTEIEDSSDLEDIIDGIFEDEDTKSVMRKKIFAIIDEYLYSEDGRKSIIEKFEDAIDEYDVLNNDRITDVIVEFFKRNLERRN